MSETRTLTVPALSLVVLVGASGSGKSTFARAHFLPTEVLSSDFCRGLVSDDENDQAATKAAFELLHFIVAKRLAAGRLTVIDATSVKREDRKPLVELARRFHVLPVAIVLNLPEKLAHARNRDRPDRQFGPHVVRNQTRELRRSLKGLQREGFRHVHVLSSPEEIETVAIERTKLWNDRRDKPGPFDLIGDVHGCCDELEQLLAELGYEVVEQRDGEFPDGSIIYGPEYTEPKNLERLRERALGRKRSLAEREFALGIEGLERFIRNEPLRRVHECVFGVLALESEPVDPRL